MCASFHKKQLRLKSMRSDRKMRKKCYRTDLYHKPKTELIKTSSNASSGQNR